MSEILTKYKLSSEKASLSRGKAKRNGESIQGVGAKDMVVLSLEIAAKVIQQKIEQDEKVISKNLKHALKHLLDKGRIIIKLNPADLEIVSKHSKEIKSAEGLKELILEEDSEVTRGGCLIHSELGHIDAQIETQLEMIGKAL